MCTLYSTTSIHLSVTDDQGECDYHKLIRSCMILSNSYTVEANVFIIYLSFNSACVVLFDCVVLMFITKLVLHLEWLAYCKEATRRTSRYMYFEKYYKNNLNIHARSEKHRYSIELGPKRARKIGSNSLETGGYTDSEFLPILKFSPSFIEWFEKT